MKLSLSRLSPIFTAVLLACLIPVGVFADEAPSGFLKITSGDGQPLMVEINKETYEVKPGADTVAVPAGEQTVVVRGKGKIPVTGPVRIEAGKTTTLNVALESVPDKTTEIGVGWGLVGTGFALIVATIIVDQTVDFDDQSTRDATVWTLAGVGGAMTVAGGILLSYGTGEENPEPKDVPLNATIGFGGLPDGGMVTGLIRF
ncbi:MAG: hypothetical protein HUU55_05550 [Myxococcales bacterium]|nr:hypothetical protein [Myxococcales bacterium]